MLAEAIRLGEEGVNRETANMQTLWDSFKLDLAKLAKDANSTSYHKLNSCINTIKNDLHTILADPILDADESAHTNAAFLSNELEHLTKVRAKNQRNRTRAGIAL